MRFRIAALVLLLWIAGIAGAQTPPGFRDVLVANRLQLPVGCEFAPDGRLFILLKNGLVLIRKNGAILPTPALGIRVNNVSERGLLGIAFDPAFASNHYVYIYYSTDETVPQNRLSRFVIQGDVINPASEVIILQGIRSDSGMHNGGCLKFGRDGKLYVATGDGGSNHQLSQDLSSLNGKILRINSNGSVPPDNPFANQAGKRGEIWCYGLRNPWRFDIDPQSGKMFIADVGGGKFEEINIGKGGANYGWPKAEGVSQNKNFTNPIYSYPHVQGRAAVIGGVVYNGSQFPAEYRGSYFFGDAVLGFVRTLTTGGSNGVVVKDFFPNAGRLVHITQGPDGALYYLKIWEGELRKIQYVSGNNSAPVVKATASKKWGLLPLSTTFSGAGSIDPDGDPLTYHWDFGDGTSADGIQATHVYQAARNVSAQLTVTDSKGASTKSQLLRIYPGDRPPVSIIRKPAAGRTAAPGETVAFEGSATDPDEGTLPASRLTWTVVLHHDTHTHPYLGPLKGTNQGSFTLPTDDHLQGNIFYRIRLKATDARGLSTSTFVDVPIR